MSFGFSVGDFLAVAELAHRLHRDVICVARKAPEELANLSKELGALSMVLTSLKEDVLNPESPLAKSGPDRIATATSAVQFTGETLKKLELLRDKYGLLNAADRSKSKKVWDRLKFSKDLPNINNLRSKLNYHYNIITLLLVAGANSSLERIEATQKDEAKNLASIIESIERLAVKKSRVSQVQMTPALPILSAVEEAIAQNLLSQLFMEKAELVGSWLTIGLDTWLQAGRWWLLRYLSSKASLQAATLPIGTQAYVDLLKAAWIIVDVVKEHPQRDYIMSGTQQITIRETTEVVASELLTINKNQDPQQLPSLKQIEEADLDIFPRGSGMRLGLSGDALTPSLSLRARGYVVLFQRVGTWISMEREGVEGLVLVLWSKESQTLHLIVQDQSGRDAVDVDFKCIGRFSVSARNAEPFADSDMNGSELRMAPGGKPYKTNYSFSDKNFSWKNCRFATYADEPDHNDTINEEDSKAQDIDLELSSSVDVLQFYLLLTSVQLYRFHFSSSHNMIDLHLFCDVGSIVAITTLKWKLSDVLHIFAARAFSADMASIRNQYKHSSLIVPEYTLLHSIILAVAQSTGLSQPSDKIRGVDLVSQKQRSFNIKTASTFQPFPIQESPDFYIS